MKTIITNRAYYEAAFAATISDDNELMIEIIETRPLYVVAEEFEDLESIVYENQDVGTKTFTGFNSVKMIQHLPKGHVQMILYKK